MPTSKKFRRKHNLNKIKSMPYRYQELADTLGVKYGSVLRWIKGGMKTIAGARLIHGDDAKEFLAEKQKKTKMQDDELWCCKCQKPRKAFGGLADIDFSNPKKPNLKAICEVCESNTNRNISPNDIAKFKQIFDAELLGVSALIQSENNSSNDTKKGVMINGKI